MEKAFEEIVSESQSTSTAAPKPLPSGTEDMIDIVKNYSDGLSDASIIGNNRIIEKIISGQHQVFNLFR